MTNMKKKMEHEPSVSLNYCQELVASNPQLSGLTEFYLYPGMEFQSPVKWWPDSGMRPTLHEGIDFCYFGTSSGEEKVFSQEISVPVMTAGKIVAICPDYLGYTVFFDHLYGMDLRFLSIYAHIIPRQTLRTGQHLQGGKVIGHVADTTGRKNRMPAHLHLSIMQVDREVTEEMLTWDLICNSARGTLVDPLEVIGREYISMREYNHWKEEVLRGLS
jgi:hypothetical protein